MSNDIMVLIAERDAAKRLARNSLEGTLRHRAGSPNYGWHAGQLEDALREHAEICAAIEGMGYLRGHEITVDKLEEYAQ